MESKAIHHAPGDLELVRNFTNTSNEELEREDFRSPELIRLWLVERHLLDPQEPLSAEDAQRIVDFREGVRELLIAHNTEAMASGTIEHLNQILGDICVQFRFDVAGNACLEPQSRGADGVMGRLLTIIYAAIADCSWIRLKACRNCHWAFYDLSKNLSATWCASTICGSRLKARAYRRRQREAD